MEAELFESLRAEVFERASAVTEETDVEKLLADIGEHAERDLSAEFGGREELHVEEVEGLLASVEAWASLASYVTREVYAGPLREVGAMRLHLAGWAKGVAAALTRLAGLLRGYLARAQQALSALSYSIGVSFPGGVSVSLSW
jgi:hypothetical protein